MKRLIGNAREGNNADVPSNHMYLTSKIWTKFPVLGYTRQNQPLYILSTGKDCRVCLVHVDTAVAWGVWDVVSAMEKSQTLAETLKPQNLVQKKAESGQQMSRSVSRAHCGIYCGRLLGKLLRLVAEILQTSVHVPRIETGSLRRKALEMETARLKLFRPVPEILQTSSHAPQTEEGSLNTSDPEMETAHLKTRWSLQIVPTSVVQVCPLWSGCLCRTGHLISQRGERRWKITEGKRTKMVKEHRRAGEKHTNLIPPDAHTKCTPVRNQSETTWCGDAAKNGAGIPDLTDHEMGAAWRISKPQTVRHGRNCIGRR
jgi:hypothetical protein